MNFANTQVLWLLAVLPPALMGFYWWTWRQRQRLLTQFIQARLLPGLISGVSPARQKIRMGCIVLAVVLLIFALARPQWGFSLQESKQIGLDIVVAIDTSKSMLAQDIAPNRLGRAKLAALDLMQQAHSDRMGLVAFAGDAFLQCPLTIDDTAFRQSVEALDVNTVPRGGTSLSSAINTALGAFKEGDNYKVLVLFTDGEDNDTGDEGALSAAQAAAKDGLIIFTVGVGTAEGELLRVTDQNGQSDYVRDDQGNVVKSHLNEPLLKQIAGATKGFYLPLRGAGTIDALYQKGLAPLPKSEQGTRMNRIYNEHYHWPLGAAMMLLLVEMLLPERKRRRAEAPAPTAASALSGAAVALVLMISLLTAKASPADAQKDYQSGNYDGALKEYQHELEKKSDDPRLHYDAGVSAYRDKQYNEAAKQFDQAIGAPDLKLQEGAYYNLGNALFRAGEGNQDPDKKKQTWQDAVREYQNTLALNPADLDAKHNLEFVKKKLEELQKQQQQQNQQNQNQQNQDQNQQQQANNQQNQQNQQSQQQQSQSQQQKDQSQQNQQQANGQQNQNQQQSQSQQNQQGQNQQDQQQQQAQQNQSQQTAQDQAQQNQQNGQQQEQAQAGGGEKQNQEGQEAQQQEAEMERQGRMTPQEARRLLDAQKGDEQILQWNNGKEKAEDNNRPIKDW